MNDVLELPVVDFTRQQRGDADERRRFAHEFGEALRVHGFAVVSGHPMSRERIERAFETSRRLFARPLDEKLRCVVPASKGNRGYVPFGGERSVGASVADLKEFYHVGQVRPAPGADLLPNAWPEGDAAFEAEMTSLYRDFERTASSLLAAIEAYLELPRDALSSMIDGGDSILRLIHYPPVPDDAPEGALRAAAHEDINLITLLAEGSTGGLEVVARDGRWHPVRMLQGNLVINAGDMLQHLAGGRIRSTTHRVVNPMGENRSRYSIPFFTHPRPDVVLTPMPPARGVDVVARAPITAGAYLRERLDAIAVAT